MNGKKKFPKRGEIYWVNFNTSLGTEIKKNRPALIISNDIGNEVSDIVTVAPLTRNIKHVYPFEVKIVLDQVQCKVMLNQCRSIDKSRLKNRIQSLEPEIMKEVDIAIKIAFGLN